MKNYIKISFIVFLVTLFNTVFIDLFFLNNPVLEIMDLSILSVVLLNTLVAGVLLLIREIKGVK